jgi:hypothetical protein
MGAHICNPSYLGGKGRRIYSSVNMGKVSETLYQKQNTARDSDSQTRLLTTWKAEIGRIVFKTSLLKKIARFHLN